MTHRPRFSIVTATLNRKALLQRTIDSIRLQTYGDFEHIVMDGGSTDGTVEMLRDLEKDYPMRWRSEPDRGMYDAINKGLAEVNGEIVAYLNSDDLYFPWTLEVVAAEFERRPSVDFIFGDALSVEDATGVRRMYWQFPFHRDAIRRSAFLAQPTVFWRRRALERLGGFDDSLRFVADCDYWMRASKLFEFHKVNELLAVERDHESTLRVKNASALASELLQVRSRYVTMHGTRHRAANALNVRRAQLIERVYAVAFLIQSRVPRNLRRGPWRRFLDADRTRIHARTALRLLLPRQTHLMGHAMEPSRRWLEPPS